MRKKVAAVNWGGGGCWSHWLPLARRQRAASTKNPGENIPTSPTGGRSSRSQGRLKPELANLFFNLFSGSATNWAFPSSAPAPSCNPSSPEAAH